MVLDPLKDRAPEKIRLIHEVEKANRIMRDQEIRKGQVREHQIQSVRTSISYWARRKGAAESALAVFLSVNPENPGFARESDFEPVGPVRVVR